MRPVILISFLNASVFSDLIGWNRAVNTHIINKPEERSWQKSWSDLILNAFTEHLQQRSNKIQTGRARFRNYQKFWSRKFQ